MNDADAMSRRPITDEPDSPDRSDGLEDHFGEFQAFLEIESKCTKPTPAMPPDEAMDPSLLNVLSTPDRDE